MRAQLVVVEWKIYFQSRAVAKPGIALAWGARGPEFKSRQPDQIPQRVTDKGPSSGGLLESKWSPKRDAGLFASGRKVAVASWCFLSALNSPELSTPRETRQTRQFASNSLIMLIKCVSGSPRNPTTNPTYCPRKPDKSPARPGCWPVRPRPQVPSGPVLDHRIVPARGIRADSS